MLGHISSSELHRFRVIFKLTNSIEPSRGLILLCFWLESALNDVPIGKAMMETQLFLEIANNSDFDSESPFKMMNLDDLGSMSHKRRLTGILYLKSATRICTIGDTMPMDDAMVNTGDRVEYYKERLYYKGRGTGKLFKINGILTDLDTLESVWNLFYCEGRKMEQA
jgi:hypothetical protein